MTSYKYNFKNKTDGIDLLASLDSNSIKVAFFDPQYRGLLNKMSYGNEGARQENRCNLKQMSNDEISQFITEFERVLKPSGYLFLWVDKFHLCEGIKQQFIDKTADLQCVDMITWNKQKMGMGYRTRRKSEYLIIIQKKPILAKATWSLHNIPDVWDEKVVKTHPHSKPVGLQKQLICATTEIDDVVCDPAAGGYSVMQACQETNRNFIGGDIEFGELPKNF